MQFKGDTVLVTVDLGASTTDPNVAAAAAIGVPLAAIDTNFGVLVVNAGLHRHAVKVDSAAFRERCQTRYTVSGPFGDPAIEAF